MEIEVRYQSRSGNTEKVARAIARKLNLQAQSVQSPLAASVDVLFLGGAVYAGGLHKDLKKFLKTLHPGQAQNIVLFSTAMGPKNISTKVEKLLRGKDTALFGQEFHAPSAELGAALPQAGAFAENVLSQIESRT